MKVHELIGKLLRYKNQDLDVFIASDAEGNKLNKIHELTTGAHYIDDFNSIEFDDSKVKTCVVIWPC